MSRSALVLALALVLLALTSPISAASGEIFVTPVSSGGSWLGDCALSNCGPSDGCTMLVSMLTIALDDTVVQCNIHLLGVSTTTPWTNFNLDGSGLSSAVKISITSASTSNPGLVWNNVRFMLAMPLTLDLGQYNLTTSSSDSATFLYAVDSSPPEWPPGSGLPNVPFANIRNGFINEPFFSFGFQDKLSGLFSVDFVDIFMSRTLANDGAWVTMNPNTVGLPEATTAVYFSGGQILSSEVHSPLVTSLFDNSQVTFRPSQAETVSVHELRFSSLLDTSLNTEAAKIFLSFDGTHAITESNGLINPGDTTPPTVVEVTGAAEVRAISSVQKVLSSVDKVPYELKVSLQSFITGWDLSNAIITSGTAHLINCQYDAPVIESAFITVDPDGMLEFKTDFAIGPAPNVKQRMNGTVSLGEASTLIVSANTEFYGTPTIIGSGNCLLQANDLLFRSGLNTQLRTACSLTISHSITGSANLHSIVGVTAGVLPRLSLKASTLYSGVLIDLTNFGVFSIVPNISDPVHASLQAGPSSNLLIMNSPHDGIRVDWTSFSAAPPTDTPRLLYESSTVLNPSSYMSILDSSDIYPFEIWYADHSPTYGIYATYTSPPTTLGPVATPTASSPATASSPTAPSSQSIPPTAPICPPPPPGFSCSGGTWVSNGSVTANTSLVITSATVIVIGNLTVNGSLIFASGSTNVTIQGCLELVNGSSIVIDLSGGNGGTGNGNQITSISQAEGCPLSLTSVPVGVKQRKKGCEKASVKTADASTKNTLVLILSFDKSGCNTKWIIVGAVLGSIVLIACVVTVVVYTMVQKNKYAESREKLKATG